MPGRVYVRNALFDYAREMALRQEQEIQRTAAMLAETWTTGGGGAVYNPFAGYIVYGGANNRQDDRGPCRPSKEQQAKGDYEIDAGD